MPFHKKDKHLLKIAEKCVNRRESERENQTPRQIALPELLTKLNGSPESASIHSAAEC